MSNADNGVRDRDVAHPNPTLPLRGRALDSVHCTDYRCLCKPIEPKTNPF